MKTRTPDLYRRVERGPALALEAAGSAAQAHPGDFIHVTLVRGCDTVRRAQLGPVLSARATAAAAGVAVEAGQLLVRPVGAPTEPAPAAGGERRRVEGVVEVIPCSGDEATDRLDVHTALVTGASTVALVDRDVELPAGWLERLEDALVRSGAPAAFPLCNAAAPASLPMPGDSLSPLPRLPGGRSVWQVDTALAADWAPHVRGAPASPCCVLLSRAAAEAVARGERPDLCQAVIARDVFVWRAAERAGAVARLIDTGGGRAPEDWAQASERQRQAVARHRPAGLPVALYTSNVGPWGGVAVLFRLADELQRLGLNAAVVYHTLTAHRFAPRTPPIKVRNAAALEREFGRHVGWDRGVLVASHWGSGSVVKAIARRNPGLVATTIVQDREDLFETPDGRARRLPVEDYFGLGSGAAVARWILDSAAKDLGVDVSRFRVIPAGVDTGVFRPRRDAVERPGGPVRILAMWRPQTGVRRGMGRLRSVYEEMRRRFGARVSLELFGWQGRDGDEPPACVDVHHGTLSQEGVAALMAEVDVVVEPSEYQGWGLPGLEAIACGAALVSTDCLGPREYVRDGENGLLVPHAELAEGVARVVEDEAFRRRLRDAAPAAARRFDWRIVAAEWVTFLGEIWAGAGHDTSLLAPALDVARRRLREIGR